MGSRRVGKGNGVSCGWADRQEVGACWPEGIVASVLNEMRWSQQNCDVILRYGRCSCCWAGIGQWKNQWMGDHS